MNLSSFIPGARVAPWLIGGAAVAGALLLGYCALHAGQQARTDAAVARVGQVVAEGHAAASVDAVGVVDAHAEKSAQTTDIAKDNANAIQAAEGAKDSVNPALAGVAKRGLCKYAAYRSRPECVQQAHTGAVAVSR